jgi:hypothetical protein
MPGQNQISVIRLRALGGFSANANHPVPVLHQLPGADTHFQLKNWSESSFLRQHLQKRGPRDELANETQLGRVDPAAETAAGDEVR